MSLFNGPEEHAANPPDAWRVVKVRPKMWRLVALNGVVLATCQTRRDCVDLCERGFYRSLYDDETRWYAGEAIVGWKPYSPTVRDAVGEHRPVPR